MEQLVIIVLSILQIIIVLLWLHQNRIIARQQETIAALRQKLEAVQGALK